MALSFRRALGLVCPWFTFFPPSVYPNGYPYLRSLWTEDTGSNLTFPLPLPFSRVHGVSLRASECVLERANRVQLEVRSGPACGAGSVLKLYGVSSVRLSE